MTEIEKPLKSKNRADVVQKWYAELSTFLLYELMLAANYMDIKPLWDLTGATVATMVTPEDIRRAFRIASD